MAAMHLGLVLLQLMYHAPLDLQADHHEVVSMRTGAAAKLSVKGHQHIPAMTSEAPEINFVRECTTTSAPQRAGEMIMGLNVLSTTNLTPCGQTSQSATALYKYF